MSNRSYWGYMKNIDTPTNSSTTIKEVRKPPVDVSSGRENKKYKY